MMFKASEIGERCNCGVAFNVGEKPHNIKRFLVPEGYYGNQYQRAKYYVAWWMTLKCQECGHTLEDFQVRTWSPQGNGEVHYGNVMPMFKRTDDDRLHYAEIYSTIKQQMK